MLYDSKKTFESCRYKFEVQKISKNFKWPRGRCPRYDKPLEQAEGNLARQLKFAVVLAVVAVESTAEGRKKRTWFVCMQMFSCSRWLNRRPIPLSDKMCWPRKRRAYTGSTGYAIKRANLPCILRRSTWISIEWSVCIGRVCVFLRGRMGPGRPEEQVVSLNVFLAIKPHA